MLVDLQKTQAFFIITVQVAASLALTSASLLQPSTLNQLWRNIILIGNINFSACYPVILNMTILRQYKPLPVFELVLSAICVVGSAIQNRRLQSWWTSPGDISFGGGLTLPECGSSKPTLPTQTCSLDETLARRLRGTDGTLVIPFIYMALLIIERIDDKFTFSFRDWCEDSKIAKVLLGVAQTPLVAMTLATFLKYCDFFPNDSEQDWTLGQVISVAIWFPVFLQYEFMVCFGMEEGHERSLLDPWRVVNTGKQGGSSASLSSYRPPASPTSPIIATHYHGSNAVYGPYINPLPQAHHPAWTSGSSTYWN